MSDKTNLTHCGPQDGAPAGQLRNMIEASATHAAYNTIFHIHYSLFIFKFKKKQMGIDLSHKIW